MKTKTVWREKMQFVGSADGNETVMDTKSPLGDGKGLTPKELVALGVSGCTAMDVIALMKKYKQKVEQFSVSADVEMSEGVQPKVFTKINLTFELTGTLDQEKVIEAVRLSQTKFCGVSAMLAKAAPISYVVILNGATVATGAADFQS